MVLRAIKNELFTIWDQNAVNLYIAFLAENKGIDFKFFEIYKKKSEKDKFKYETMNELLDSKESFKYPREPNDLCKIIRDTCRLNYVKLLDENIIRYKKENRFIFKSNISIEGLKS